MRLYHGRQNGATKEPKYRTLYDQRGRHTKADLVAKRAFQRAALESVLYPPRTCGCDPRLHRMDYSDGYEVCTGCGIVAAEHLLQPAYAHHGDAGNGRANRGDRDRPAFWGFMGATTPSTPYKRINHMAELIKSAMDMDPRIPQADMAEIVANAEAYWGQHGDVDPVNYDAAIVKGFIRPLGPAKTKKYSERWLQILRTYVGRDYYDRYGREMMGDADALRVHKRYAVFAQAFENLRREGHPLFVNRHNIPYLNTCVLHLLYQDSPNNVERYGWYFTGLETIGSRLITEYRIAIIITYIIKHPNLNLESIPWRYKCLLPQEDKDLYLQDPDRFHRILHQQIRLCQQQPRRSRSASSQPSTAQPLPSSTSQSTEDMESETLYSPQLESTSAEY